MNDILVIEDDPGIREFIQGFLEDRDFRVETAPDGEAGVNKFKGGDYKLVICDMMMPRMTGLQVLQHIREIKPAQTVIMMSGVKEDSMVKKAKDLGCHLYITKPVRLTDLESAIRECFPEA